MHCWKSGHHVHIEFSFTNSSALNTTDPIATIPDKYRPSKNIANLGIFQYGTNIYFGYCKIFTVTNYPNGIIGQDVSSVLLSSDNKCSVMIDYCI